MYRFKDTSVPLKSIAVDSCTSWMWNYGYTATIDHKYIAKQIETT